MNESILFIVFSTCTLIFCPVDLTKKHFFNQFIWELIRTDDTAIEACSIDLHFSLDYILTYIPQPFA